MNKESQDQPAFQYILIMAFPVHHYMKVFAFLFKGDNSVEETLLPLYTNKFLSQMGYF